MAAVGQIDVEKSFSGEFWTNRYLCDIPPGDSASLTFMSAIVNIEKTLYPSAVIITKARHSTLTPNDDAYQIVVYNIPGTRPGVIVTDLLPLFNVARVDFTAGLGRPSRKYLRAALTETDISAQAITSTQITYINTNYVTPMLALTHWVDPQGEAFLVGSVSAPVGMRQLRRGSRRRTEPVL